MARFIEECWNSRNKSICRELLLPNCKHYMTGVDQPTVGPDGYQQLVDSFLTGFPDARLTVDDVFAEAEKVCLMWTLRGTHQGTFNGIPPTNRPVVIKGVAVSRVVDGRILKIISVFDNDSFTRQVSASPEKAVESWKKTSIAGT